MATCALCGATATSALMGKDVCAVCASMAQESFWCSMSRNRTDDIVILINSLVKNCTSLPHAISVTPTGYISNICMANVKLIEGYDTSQVMLDKDIGVASLYQAVSALEAPKTLAEIAAAIDKL